jgi:Xaa-Pro aminopeptidase
MLVFFAYAIVTSESVVLFVNGDQVDESVRQHLGTDVEIQSYDSFFPYLRSLGGKLGLNNQEVSLIVVSLCTGN